jgi:FAD/FMN-containing dehydrogenase
MTAPWTNWSGNQRAVASRVMHPSSTAEVAAAVRTAAAEGVPVNAVGTGHSFTSAAVTSGMRVELDGMAALISVSGHVATVQGGMPLHR